MNRLQVDKAILKSLIKASGFSCSEIEQQTRSAINVNLIKGLVGGYVKTISKGNAILLAQLLGCSTADFTSDVLERYQSVPFETNFLLAELFQADKTQIFPQYERALMEYKRNIGFQNLFRQVQRLAEIVTRPNDTFAFEETIINCLEVITSDFNLNGNSFTTSLKISTPGFVWMQRHMQRILIDGYSTHGLFLVFFYGLILFDTVFSIEMLLSAFLQSPQRRRNDGIVDQYAHIAIPIEKLSYTIMDNVLNRTARFDGPNITEFGLDENINEMLCLLILACDQCRRHFDSDFAAAQFVSIPTLNAIKTRLLRQMEKIDIIVFEPTGIDVQASSFMQNYYLLQSTMPKPQKQKKKLSTDNTGFLAGYNVGSWMTQNTMMMWMVNTQRQG